MPVVYAQSSAVTVEAKTLGCLPGILRQVQGPPTTRRRLATGDLDDTSQRAVEAPRRINSGVKSNSQVLGEPNVPLAPVPSSRSHALLSNRKAQKSPELYLDLSIRAANANRFRVQKRLASSLHAVS